MTDTLTNQTHWQPIKNGIKALTSGLDHFDDFAHILIQEDQIALNGIDAFSNRGGHQNLVISLGSECIQYTLLSWESHSCIRVRLTVITFTKRNLREGEDTSHLISFYIFLNMRDVGLWDIWVFFFI